MSRTCILYRVAVCSVRDMQVADEACYLTFHNYHLRPMCFSYRYYISTGRRELQKYTPEACQLKYQFELDPCLKTGPWKIEERTKLRQLVEKFGSRNWDAVAFDLKGRTSFDCCREYQRLQQEMRHSDRAGLLRFGAEDIIVLIHTYVVAGGNWSLVG